MVHGMLYPEELVERVFFFAEEIEAFVHILYEPRVSSSRILAKIAHSNTKVPGFENVLISASVYLYALHAL
jgi:hypothetical protein